MTEQPIRLARYFEVFIEEQVAQRKYGSATEVIEEALRLLEAREATRTSLERALAAGARSGEATPFHMGEWLDQQERLDAQQ